MGPGLRLLAVCLTAVAASGCGEGVEIGEDGPLSVTGESERPARTVTVPLGDAEPADDPPPAGDGCEGADLRPRRGNLDAVEDAVLCLVNAQRTRRSLEPLDPSSELAGAAARKAQDMVEQGYFAHVGPDGRSVTDWVRGTGYLPARGGWTLAENIGAATGDEASPGRLVRAWMNSASHRRNILAEDLAHSGVGVALGTPESGDGGSTYAHFFGSRTPPGPG